MNSGSWGPEFQLHISSRDYLKTKPVQGQATKHSLSKERTGWRGALPPHLSQFPGTVHVRMASSQEEREVEKQTPGGKSGAVWGTAS